ncbi:MAG: anhydro-N-acetylmuramic acid kinase [Tenericutes bacterium 4572_104]|nr:MAG: anhydro-N-acetylmuramic acid kinase [Tenericutes bacterium 4572_104]
MKKKIISIMSGTSLDGIDILLGEIEEAGLKTKVEVIFSKTYMFEKRLKERIQIAISNETSTSKLLCSLNFEIAKAFSECILNFCEIYKINLEEIDYIVSHGQTIYHIPFPERDYVASTLQLGDGSALANLIGVPVISNFRTADMALGGQGAPLVTYPHYILLSNNKKTRAIQNIGGISNVTVLPKNGKIKDIISFDNGPGNMMMNRAMKKLFNKEYDKDGLISAKGALIIPMFKDILKNSYFHKSPPKTTGRELFGDQYTDKLLEKYSDFKDADIITTLTHVTAFSIVKSYRDFVCKKYQIDEVVLTGGGSKNNTLVELIKFYLKGIEVSLVEDLGYSSDYLEALCFLIIGNETLNNNPSNVPNATGAKGFAILGQISPVLRKR